MLSPFAERAYADESKFLGYCLNTDHPYGKHKARVFKSALGVATANWEVAVLTAALLNPASPAGHNGCGELYVVGFNRTHGDKAATVRTSWIASMMTKIFHA